MRRWHTQGRCGPPPQKHQSSSTKAVQRIASRKHKISYNRVRTNPKPTSGTGRFSAESVVSDSRDRFQSIPDTCISSAVTGVDWPYATSLSAPHTGATFQLEISGAIYAPIWRCRTHGRLHYSALPSARWRRLESAYWSVPCFSAQLMVLYETPAYDASDLLSFILHLVGPTPY